MLEVKNINKSYGKKDVLCGASFSAKEGSIVGILGKNGCGKSTLLSILAGVIKSDSGEILYNNEDLLKNNKRINELCGFVVQGTPLIEELSAYDNLLLWYSKKEIDDSASGGLIKLLGVDEFLKTKVGKMSGGMKKRLSIACALSKDPQIIIMDEPTAALDLPCRAEILSFILDCKKKNKTVIIATHTVDEIEICDELFVIKDGNITKAEFDGDIEALVKTF